MNPVRPLENPLGLPGVPAPILAACGLSFALYLGAYMRMPLVPLFASGMGASTVQVGMINAGFMVAATLLSFPLGLVSDRLGRKRLVLAGMTISGLTSLLLVGARSPAHVGAIYLFSGIGLACFSPAMMSYVGDVSPPRFLGRAYGWYTSALYLGMAAGPGLGGAIGSRGFRAAFLSSAAVIGLSVLLGAGRLPAPPAATGPGPAHPFRSLREIAGNRVVTACWVATFFSTYAWGALFAFFPLYARDSGIPLVHTGLIFTVQAAANALSRIPLGYASDRTGGRPRYVLFGNLLFALAVGLVGTQTRPALLYLLFGLAGAGMSATFTAIGAILSEAVEPRVRGLAMGGYNTCIYGGFALSAATLGTVIEGAGFRAGFAAAGLLCAASTLVFARVHHAAHR